MSIRAIALGTTFVAAATAAILMVAGTTASGPLLVIDDGALETGEAPPTGVGLEYAHVRDYLASVPDPKNLFSSGKPSPLPFAPSIGIRHFRRERAVPGTIEIVSGTDTVGLFQACVELIPIDSTHFVLHRAWHEPEVVVIVVDITRLQPLPLADPIEQAEAVRDGESFFMIDPAACTEVRIPRDLEPGRHKIVMPEEARAIRELFLFFPSTRQEAPNKVHVMRIEPRHDRIHVVAPVKKAFAEFDDAQTAARLMRDPTTGRVVGDGMRTRAFVLSNDLARLERWID